MAQSIEDLELWIMNELWLFQAALGFAGLRVSVQNPRTTSDSVNASAVVVDERTGHEVKISVERAKMVSSDSYVADVVAYVLEGGRWVRATSVRRAVFTGFGSLARLSIGLYRSVARRLGIGVAALEVQV